MVTGMGEQMSRVGDEVDSDLPAKSDSQVGQPAFLRRMTASGHAGLGHRHCCPTLPDSLPGAENSPHPGLDSHELRTRGVTGVPRVGGTQRIQKRLSEKGKLRRDAKITEPGPELLPR